MNLNDKIIKLVSDIDTHKYGWRKELAMDILEIVLEAKS